MDAEITFEKAKDAFLEGLALLNEKNYLEAIKFLHVSNELLPNRLGTLVNLTTAYIKLEDSEKSLKYSRHAKELFPDDLDACLNFGSAASLAKQFFEAKQAFLDHIEKFPYDYRGFYNAALTFYKTNELNDCLSFLNKALDLEPELADIHWTKSLCLLKMGDFLEGWKEYEWRYESEAFTTTKPVVVAPLWDGESLPGKNLLLKSEQGVGDEVMFSSIFAELAYKFEKIYCEVDSRLKKIFLSSFPSNFVFGDRGQFDLNKDLDRQIALGSLPMLFRNNEKSFLSASSGFLKAPEEYLRKKKNLKRALKTKIGISWRSSNSIDGKLRSISVRQLLELFFGLDVDLVVLQHGQICEKELEILSRAKPKAIIPNTDLTNDLNGVFGEIASCDLVVTVDNSIAHFAGSLGVDTWVLLPYSCDWRWQLMRRDTPWYRSLNLFRQEADGNWSLVLSEVRERLLEMT